MSVYYFKIKINILIVILINRSNSAGECKLLAVSVRTGITQARLCTVPFFLPGILGRIASILYTGYTGGVVGYAFFTYTQHLIKRDYARFSHIVSER